jgi:hypothetical protein
VPTLDRRVTLHAIRKCVEQGEGCGGYRRWTSRYEGFVVTRGKRRVGERCLAVLGPLVLAANLLFLLGGEVVLDVEGLADLLGGLALDHVGDGLAADVEKGLDVHVVGSEDDLEEHLLVDLHELLIPLLNVGGLLAGVGVLVLLGGRVLLVVVAPFENLAQDSLGDLKQHVSASVGCDVTVRGRLTFMMGIGSSPGVPRSSIMFLISIERSAMIRSGTWVSKAGRDGGWVCGHTSLDVDAIRADKDDLLIVGGSHVMMKVGGIVGCGGLKVDKRGVQLGGS